MEILYFNQQYQHFTQKNNTVHHSKINGILSKFKVDRLPFLVKFETKYFPIV